MYGDFIILVAEVAIVTLAMRNSYHILATQIEAKVETSTKRASDGASDSPHPASSIFCCHL